MMFVCVQFVLLPVACLGKGVPRDFYWAGARPKDRRPRAGVGFWGRAATPSPPARGSEAAL